MSRKLATLILDRYLSILIVFISVILPTSFDASKPHM